MLSAIACGDAEVLEALTDSSLNTLEQSGTDLKTYTMVRIAALIAMDAAPVSYAITVEGAAEVLEPEEIQSILVALAPVVGSARIACAASNILDVYFDELVEEEDDDEIGFVQMEGGVEEAVAAEDGAEDIVLDDEREAV
jgi:hypothetical protein